MILFSSPESFPAFEDFYIKNDCRKAAVENLYSVCFVKPLNFVLTLNYASSIIASFKTGKEFSELLNLLNESDIVCLAKLVCVRKGSGEVFLVVNESHARLRTGDSVFLIKQNACDTLKSD